MNNIRDVYYRLCTEFKSYQSIMDEAKETIIINDDIVRVDIDRNKINLYVKGSGVASCKIPKEDRYNYIYNMVKHFIKNYKKFVFIKIIYWVLFGIIVLFIIYIANNYL